MEIVRACLEEAGFSVRTREGEDDAVVVGFEVLERERLLVVALRGLPPGGVREAFADLEVRRRAAGLPEAVGIVLSEPGFRRVDDQHVWLLPYDDLVASLVDHRRYERALAREYEARGASFLPRRGVAAGVEVDAVEHILAWSRRLRGSLVVTGPAGCGKSETIEHVRYLLAREALEKGRAPFMITERHRTPLGPLERRAMNAGNFACWEKDDGVVHCATLERLARDRTILECRTGFDDAASDARIEVLHITPLAPDAIARGAAAHLDDARRRWFEAAVEREGDFRDLASRLTSLTPLVWAARRALVDASDSPSNGALADFTLSVVHAYVARVAGELRSSYRGDEVVADLENAALEEWASGSRQTALAEHLRYNWCEPVVASWIECEGSRASDLDRNALRDKELRLATPLLRDALLARRIVRDERLGRTSTRARLRLDARVERLVDRELARLGA
jgi:hypothetical protein